MSGWLSATFSLPPPTFRQSLITLGNSRQCNQQSICYSPKVGCMGLVVMDTTGSEKYLANDRQEPDRYSYSLLLIVSIPFYQHDQEAESSTDISFMRSLRNSDQTSIHHQVYCTYKLQHSIAPYPPCRLSLSLVNVGTSATLTTSHQNYDVDWANIQSVS